MDLFVNFRAVENSGSQNGKPDLTKVVGIVQISEDESRLLCSGQKIRVVHPLTNGQQITLNSIAHCEIGHHLFGYTDSVYWFRFSVVNNLPTRNKWFLEISYPHLDDIIFYTIEKNGDRKLVTGDHHRFSSRSVTNWNFVFPLELDGSEIRQIYIRVQSQSTMKMPIRALWFGDSL